LGKALNGHLDYGKTGRESIEMAVQLGREKIPSLSPSRSNLFNKLASIKTIFLSYSLFKAIFISVRQNNNAMSLYQYNTNDQNYLS